MSSPNYTRTIVLHRSPREVYNAIRRIADWWTINTEGTADRVGDDFTISFSDPVSGQLVHRTTQRITEADPGRRLSWTVTACHMPWLKNREEWKGTTMVFDIVAVAEGARIDFTHIGLDPRVECFEQCERGWAYFLSESLLALINTGTGRPDTSGRNHMDTIGHVHPTNA